MAEQKPVQHTPKHLEDGGVFDERHPAASAFAPAQPGAGVVADDVEEKGQNLEGRPTASEANETWSDQKEVLAAQHNAKLLAASQQAQVEPVEVDPVKGTAKSVGTSAGVNEDKPPAEGGKATTEKSTPPKATDTK